MFFTQYHPMSTEEVLAGLSSLGRAEGSVSGCLAGKAFRLCLDGRYAPAQLEYRFLDGETLELTENGTKTEAPYTAMALGKMVLFSHLVPGTDRGWHVVLDTQTCAVTAFETWFGTAVPLGVGLYGELPPTGWREIPREVQREYYFGWADFGGNAKPEKLHTPTNRIEGRGLHWTLSDGHEFLTFFPSLCCSTVVELGGEMGGITLTNGSDYIRVDDEFYVYTRWETEFGGGMWLEVLNFYDNRAIGMHFGFDAEDRPYYAFHTAALEITGDIAHLEGIFDLSDKKRPRYDPEKKGSHYAYRPMDIDPPMPHEEALQYAAEKQLIFDTDNRNIMASRNLLPFSDFLAGKQFKVVMDCEKHAAAPWTGDRSVVYEYDVISGTRLKWRVPGGAWQEEKYFCYEPARDIYFFSHMLTGEPDYANLTVAVDFSTGLATTIRAQIGNWHSGWETGSQVRFGVLEYGDIVPPFTRRHHFTTDLVGKSYSWTYSDKMCSIHVYSSPESYSWTIFAGDNSGGATWSSPCYYIKLREDAYILQWVEENCNGRQGTVMINPRLLHDSGFFFGVDRQGLSLNPTGAFGRQMGSFNIMNYFDPTGNI